MSDATKTARDEFEEWCMRENGKWGKKVIERHSDGRYCVLQTYMDWTAWQAGYFSAISAIKSQRDELLEERNRLLFHECQLVESLKSYMNKYGPGYSSTDTLAYDNAAGVLSAIANAEKGATE